MKMQQSGFTLIELAIVLVIIGLLLGGVLKGQELINSAKVKNIASELKNTQIYIYSYQDKFKALPGDDRSAQTHVAATGATIDDGDGNGVIGGAWNSTTPGDESFEFWQHVRLAGLDSGPTDKSNVTEYLPTNSEGGVVGVQSNPQNTITGLTGSYAVCTGGIVGKMARDLDTQLDDGNTLTGSVMVASTVTGLVGVAPVAANAANFDSTKYVVCVAF